MSNPVAPYLLANTLVFSPALQGPAGPPPITTLTGVFIMPAVSASATAAVGTTAWMVVGGYVQMAGAGVLQIASIPSLGSVVLTNTGAIGNAAPGTVIEAGAQVGVGAVTSSGGSANPPIELSVGTTTTTTSTATIAAEQRAYWVLVSVETAYSSGTTFEVGYAGALGAFLASDVVDPTVTTTTAVAIRAVLPSTEAVVVTLAGSPSAGAMTVTVFYATTTS